ncbi:hypothetical protein LIS66_27320 (plasmid) [Pseudomonas sp. HN2]|uniref:hypothetical protein n=1 Tax=Pseudomonas sp. HN2 TaxID=2884805 RepID=UPI001D14CADE|nr:hypothetical protein [Pseudomonas sp. HN2]UEB98687.1 hypothetical protein LIS66_27615 [Pseudomonas sp. HN2]UEB98743.1 hypothetical protein LIS66_27320 [Pseudomonas sp. HN2]
MTQAKPLTNAQQVAATILDQLGARRFMVMTGARELVATSQGLQFKLPASFARAGVNMIRVELNAMDTYDVIAGRWARLDFKEKTRENGVYGEDLQRAFTRLTGLDTHL